MEYFYFACIWAAAGFVNGISGMGAALMAVPLMTLFLDIQLIVPLSCILVTLLSSALALKYRTEFHVRLVLPALIGAVPGAVLGTELLKCLSPLILETVMAVFLIAYTAWSSLQKGIVREERSHAGLCLLCGFFSGFFGATISFTGPPLAVYILYTGWKQQKALGALGVALIGITGISCVSHYFAGLYTQEFLSYLYIGVPAGLLGMLLSFPFIPYITQKTFRKILLAVVGCAGLMCLCRVCLHFFSV